MSITVSNHRPNTRRPCRQPRQGTPWKRRRCQRREKGAMKTLVVVAIAVGGVHPRVRALRMLSIARRQRANRAAEEVLERNRRRRIVTKKIANSLIWRTCDPKTDEVGLATKYGSARGVRSNAHSYRNGQPRVGNDPRLPGQVGLGLRWDSLNGLGSAASSAHLELEKNTVLTAGRASRCGTRLSSMLRMLRSTSHQLGNSVGDAPGGLAQLFDASVGSVARDARLSA